MKAMKRISAHQRLVMLWMPAAAMLLFFACSSDPLFLRVDLRTDWVPGIEFSTIEVRVVRRGAGPEEEMPLVEHAVVETMSFLPGGHVGEVDIDEPGHYRVYVSLYDRNGLLLTSTVGTTWVRGSQVFTSLLYRNCRDVVCLPEDGSEAMVCRDAQCFPVECGDDDDDDDDDMCPPPINPPCVADSDCSGVETTACSVGQCVEGICWETGDSSLCEADELCSPSAGGCVADDCVTNWGGDCDDLAAGGGVASGGGHSCAVAGGQLHCWGRNDRGQLGTSATDSWSASPVRVDPVDSDTEWRRVTAGDFHTCAISADGSLYCWGANDRGQLGLGDTMDRGLPTRVGSGQWRDVDSDAATTCALDRQGGFFCWGVNSENQAGRPDSTVMLTEPGQISPGSRFISIAAGQGHSCAVKETGGVYCMGRNGHGQTGTGDSEVRVHELTRVALEPRVIQVTASQDNSCALTVDGEVYCWGRGSGGALGIDTSEDARIPQRVSDINVAGHVNTSAFHTCVVTAEGGQCTGRNREGQLGQGYTSPESMPPREFMLMLNEGRRPFVAIELGRFHSCGRTVTGEVYCWGRNLSGEIGTPPRSDRSVPIQVLPLMSAP